MIAGGRVYVGSSDGKLYVLDLETGKKLSEFDAGSGITTSPAIAAGRVVIGIAGRHHLRARRIAAAIVRQMTSFGWQFSLGPSS